MEVEKYFAATTDMEECITANDSRVMRELEKSIETKLN